MQNECYEVDPFGSLGHSDARYVDNACEHQLFSDSDTTSSTELGEQDLFLLLTIRREVGCQTPASVRDNKTRKSSEGCSAECQMCIQLNTMSAAFVGVGVGIEARGSFGKSSVLSLTGDSQGMKHCTRFLDPKIVRRHIFCTVSKRFACDAAKVQYTSEAYSILDRIQPLYRIKSALAL